MSGGVHVLLLPGAKLAHVCCRCRCFFYCHCCRCRLCALKCSFGLRPTLCPLPAFVRLCVCAFVRLCVCMLTALFVCAVCLCGCSVIPTTWVRTAPSLAATAPVDTAAVWCVHTTAQHAGVRVSVNACSIVSGCGSAVCIPVSMRMLCACVYVCCLTGCLAVAHRNPAATPVCVSCVVCAVCCVVSG